MNKLAFLVLGFALAFNVHAASSCRAIDGDTVQCGKERVRLRGVYAAEKSGPGGEQARANLQRKLHSGEVRVARRGKDKYGRTLGDVYVSGRKVTQSDIGLKGGRGAKQATKTRSRTRAARGDVAARVPRSKGASGPKQASGRSARGSSLSTPRSSATGKSLSSGRSSSVSRGSSVSRSPSGSRRSGGGSRSGGRRR